MCRARWYRLVVLNDAAAARTALETGIRLASSSEANGELAFAERPVAAGKRP